MSRPVPKVDSRRTEDLYRELLDRARTWIPNWQPTGGGPDVGRALLRIAARLSSGVTERLDRTPEKTTLGLLDWLGITRHAGHAARMPVVFKMASGATDPVLAPAPVRIQANVGDTPTAFETQQDIQLVPSPIMQLVGVDPSIDATYFPPAEVLSLDAPEPGPSEWTVKSLAATGSNKIQLSPALGLQVGTILLVNDFDYKVVAEPDGDLVTIEPLIGDLDPGSVAVPVSAAGDVPQGITVSKVRRFIPFGGTSRNLQKHALYIGDDDALNLTAPACIALTGGASLPDDLVWEYWGKLGEEDPSWRPLQTLGPEGASLFLKKSDSGSNEIREVAGQTSRWIRAVRAAGDKPPVPPFEGLTLTINCSPVSGTGSESVAANCLPAEDPTTMPSLEGVANNTSLVLNEEFYPLGKIPRQFDSFYLACPEVFSKPGAQVSLSFSMVNAMLGPLVVVEMTGGAFRVFGVAKDGALHRFVLTTLPDQRLSYLGPTRPPIPVAGGVTTPSTSPVFKIGVTPVPRTVYGLGFKPGIAAVVCVLSISSSRS